MIHHISFPITLNDHIPFQGPLPASWEFFKETLWVPVTRAQRFWLPAAQMAYPAADTLYRQWLHNCHGQNLVVLYCDLGRVSGDNGKTWHGDVLLGAFRSHEAMNELTEDPDFYSLEHQMGAPVLGLREDMGWRTWLHTN